GDGAGHVPPHREMEETEDREDSWPRVGLRQGLNGVARQWAGAWSARCGGDLGSHRNPAAPANCQRGLPVKARSRPNPQKSNLFLNPT
ncbi:MAG: hypothetical protein ACO3AF_07270, partial [Flavobacteriales bacterium]